MLPPFKVIILSVRDLPNVDVAMSKEDKKADPYVRIRFTEIETGKVSFIQCTATCARRHTSNSHPFTETHMKKELKEFAKKTKAIVDVDDANFFELFNFNQVGQCDHGAAFVCPCCH